MIGVDFVQHLCLRGVQDHHLSTFVDEVILNCSFISVVPIGL